MTDSMMEDRIFIGGPLHGQTRQVAAYETRIGENLVVAEPVEMRAGQITDPVPAPKTHVYWIRIYHGQSKAYKFMVYEDLNDDDVMDMFVKCFLLLEGKPCADAKQS